jgi:hypothetical protein
VTSGLGHQCFSSASAIMTAKHSVVNAMLIRAARVAVARSL